MTLLEHNKSIRSSNLDDLKVIARLTGSEFSDMLILAAASDRFVAKDEYMKELIRNALTHQMCTSKQAFNYYEREMKKRLPQLIKEWQKVTDELRPEILAGSQSLTSTVMEDSKTGELKYGHKCSKLQSAGEEVYTNRTMAERFCRQQCGQYWKDRQEGSTLCPYTRYDIPAVIRDLGFRLADDDFYDVPTIQNVRSYIDGILFQFQLLCEERREVLTAPWHTTYDHVLEVQRFRTIDPIGREISIGLQLPMTNIVESIIELKRGCKDYARHVYRLLKGFHTHTMCDMLDGADTVEAVMDICEQCQYYEKTQRGDIACDEFYMALREIRIEG